MSLPHRTWLVAGATLMVCGLLAGGVTASPVPAGFRAASFAAINTRDWWLKGNIPCRFRHGCVAMIRTLNGGRSFVRVHVPTLVDVPSNVLGQFAFAGSENGYIAGARFWDTHDGGRRWQSVNLGGQVGSVATGDGFVYAIVSNYPRGFLMRSPVGRDAWTVLAESPAGFEGVTVDHGTVLLDESVTLGGQQRILVSHDRGASFTFSRPLPEVGCAPNEPVPRTVWMLCSGGMTDLLFRSTDGGREFSQPDSNGNPRDAPSLAGLGHAILGAADATTAVIGSQELLRTTDGGRTFKRVPMPIADRGWSYVGFFDATHGVALGLFGESEFPPGRLYYTSNGGASYRLIRI
jgi:hypothetical protein